MLSPFAEGRGNYENMAAFDRAHSWSVAKLGMSCIRRQNSRRMPLLPHECRSYYLFANSIKRDTVAQGAAVSRQWQGKRQSVDAVDDCKRGPKIAIENEDYCGGQEGTRTKVPSWSSGLNGLIGVHI